MSVPTRIAADGTEVPDLLAALQASLDKAKADLAAAERVAKAKETRAANAARVPYRKGDIVRITSPGSPSYDGRELPITAINADVDPGEVQAAGAWFALTEVTKVGRRKTPPTTSTK